MARAVEASNPTLVNQKLAALVSKRGAELVDLVFDLLAECDKLANDSRSALLERRRLSAELGLDSDQTERSISFDISAITPHRVLAGMLADAFNKRDGGRERRGWLASIG